MSISRDPEKAPKGGLELARLATELRLQIVNVICREEDAQSDDPEGISFLALLETVPRVGEHIVLENGRECEVKRVYWNVGRNVAPMKDGSPGPQYVLMAPNVLAVATGGTIPRTHDGKDS
jgi:hypothetical protein